MAALHSRCGRYIFVQRFLVSSFFLLFSSPILSRRRLDVYHDVANWKKLLTSSISPTCSHNMLNFGPLMADFSSGAWGSGFIRVLALLPQQRRRSAEANQTLNHVWTSPALVHYYTFSGALVRNGILPGAKFTMRPSLAFFYIGSVTARHSSSLRR